MALKGKCLKKVLEIILNLSKAKTCDFSALKKVLIIKIKKPLG